MTRSVAGDPSPPPAAPGLSLALALFAALLLARAWLAGSVLVALAAPLLLFAPTRRWGALLALAHYVAPFGIGRLLRAPFSAANHEFLEAWILLLVALLPGRDAMGRAALRRALGVVLLGLVLASGVQKVAHGVYPRGEYFTLAYAEPTKFNGLLDALVSAEERDDVRAYRASFERLRREARPGVLDRAPPRPAVILAVSAALSWATLAAELLLPLLLLRPGRRRLGAAVLLAFFVGVEAAAREWMFGGLVAILLVPFLAERSDAPPAPAPVPLAARVALALFCAWPLLHVGLALTTDLSPWKLGGFGMYAVPARWGAIAVETRAPGERAFTPRPPPSERERYRYEHAGAVLRNVPFASSAATSLAESIRAQGPPGAPPCEVRIRVTTMRYDRARDRHVATERVWEVP